MNRNLRCVIKRVLYLSGLFEKDPVWKFVKLSDSLLVGGKRAEELLLTKRLYLDPCLTVTKLAKEAATNRTYLSNYINSEKGCNFRQYVNLLRAAQALKLIESEKMETLSDVAIQSGFSNLRSLNRAFIAVYGKLPSQVRREYLRDKHS
jgi:AraC-like DNA-binding protein